jgi:hypothetical protein
MYKLTKLGSFIRLTDGAFIPADPANTDYQEVLAWIEQGNTPEPVDVPSAADVIEAKKQAVRKLREQVLDRLNGIAGRAVWRGNTALAEACYVASEALLDITKDLPSEPDAAELMLFSRYQVIAFNATQAAPSLEKAFAQVDA